MAVVIETTLGDITVDLFVELRPQSCLNFMKLCKMKYYNFNLFHTIQSGFIAQTGDPTGEGTGGESVWAMLHGKERRYFSSETRPKIRHDRAGLLSMVCVGDGMIGSQFFFTLAAELDSLDGVHCVIGEVTEGFDILRKLNEVICDEGHRPYQDVRITHTVILEDPFNDPPKFRPPSRSPSPSAERLAGGRIAPDEELDEYKGKSVEEIQDLIEDREAKARATILEIVGDLPDAEMAPPENVLFVCKLNSVTTDEDLEIIFSRFGKIVSCEVIRDKKSGDSLQYAFIEFSDKKSCEDAYFKMDNVLIDDRRIHVDFSQSVSKIKWLGKGRGVIHLDDNNKIKEKRPSKRAIEKNYRRRSNDRRHKSQSRERRSHSKDKVRPHKRDRNHRSHSKERSRRSSDSIERNVRRIPSKDNQRRKFQDNNRSGSRERNYRSHNREQNNERIDKSKQNKNTENRDGSRTESKDEKHLLGRERNHKSHREQNKRRSESRDRRPPSNANSNIKKKGLHKDDRTERKRRDRSHSRERTSRRTPSKDTSKQKITKLQRKYNRSESVESNDHTPPPRKMKKNQRSHSKGRHDHRSRSKDGSTSSEEKYKSQKRVKSSKRSHSKERNRHRSQSREKKVRSRDKRR